MARKNPLTGQRAAASEPEAAAANGFVFDFPERVERLDCPEPYQAHHIVVVTNQPDAVVTGQAWADLFAAAIRSWTFRLKDGSAAPITAAAIVALPPDLFEWLKLAWQDARQAPLPWKSK